MDAIVIFLYFILVCFVCYRVYKKNKKDGVATKAYAVEVILLLTGIFLILVYACIFPLIWPDLQKQVQNEIVCQQKVVRVIPEPENAPEFVEGMVAEAPIPLGGGICLVGVSFDDFHDGRDVRAVLVSADRPLVVGQKVKVKIRLISESYRPAIDLLVIQDDIPK